VRCSVEIYEITGAHIDRPDAQPRFAGIDSLEVDEALKCALQQLRVVEARRLEGTVRMEPGWRVAQREEPSPAGKHGPICAHLIEKFARKISLEPQVSEHASPVEQGICGDLLPEAAQLRHALGRRVARNNGRVNSSD